MMQHKVQYSKMVAERDEARRLARYYYRAWTNCSAMYIANHAEGINGILAESASRDYWRRMYDQASGERDHAVARWHFWRDVMCEKVTDERDDARRWSAAWKAKAKELKRYFDYERGERLRAEHDIDGLPGKRAVVIRQEVESET